jgi:outer membrane protein assembly factor BamD
MRDAHRLQPRAVLALLAVVLCAACGPEKKLTPDQYYDEATAAFADKNYQVAVERFNGLLDQYPFDPRAEEAELRIAESHYKRKHYPEAIAALNDFQRMHPMSPHLARVYFLLGQSYRDQMTTVDRDQAATESAHGWYRVVIDRYPDSPYADKARRKRAECREMLAGHELYIADYYLQHGNMNAAENRVKGLLESYPDTKVATDALERLAHEYGKAGDSERAARAQAAADDRRHRPTDDDPRTLDSAPARALLADLDERFGPSERLAESSAAPALRDPAAPRKGQPVGDQGPAYGPASGQRPDPY